MNARGASVVVAARGWIGTPYVHQAARKGAGCDCLGLLRGVWLEVVGQEPEAIPAYSKSLTDEAPGDVLLFRMRSGAVAKHFGIATKVGPQARFIHAYSGHGVTESPLSQPWRRRIVARFEFPAEAI